nr:MAG TPA: hypothetical protein [Caudoviricetes sp.]
MTADQERQVLLGFYLGTIDRILACSSPIAPTINNRFERGDSV